jgi:putative sigma-54 modulation protein
VQVTLTSRHGELDTATRDYVTRKAEKLLTYFERVTQIEVTTEFGKDRCTVEILVDAEHKHNFVAQAEAEGPTPAFDQALHKMEQQIKRYKEKVQDHRRDKPLNELAENASAGQDEEE